MPSPGDLLLYAFTNWKSVTWATFKTAVDEISAAYWMQRSSEAQEPASVLRNRILRTLEYLGHCDSDFDRDAGRVFVAPPALVLLPAAGFPRAVVSGARSPDMLAGLRSAIGQAKTRIRIEVRQPADPFLPSRIELEATEYEMFCDLASKFGMAFDEVSAAWSIAQFSGDLKTYLAGLAWSSEPELGWARLDFDPVRETFARPEAGCQPSLRLSSYQDPMRTIRRHYLWQASENAAVDLDWGRYAVFAASGSRVISYDPKTNSASVPAAAPPPRLLGRALVLCSGVAPSRTGRRQGAARLVFPSVPPDIYELIAEKLTNYQPGPKERG